MAATGTMDARERFATFSLEARHRLRAIWVDSEEWLKNELESQQAILRSPTKQRLKALTQTPARMRTAFSPVKQAAQPQYLGSPMRVDKPDKNDNKENAPASPLSNRTRPTSPRSAKKPPAQPMPRSIFPSGTPQRVTAPAASNKNRIFMSPVAPVLPPPKLYNAPQRPQEDDVFLSSSSPPPAQVEKPKKKASTGKAASPPRKQSLHSKESSGSLAQEDDGDVTDVEEEESQVAEMLLAASTRSRPAEDLPTPKGNVLKSPMHSKLHESPLKGSPINARDKPTPMEISPPRPAKSPARSIHAVAQSPTCAPAPPAVSSPAPPVKDVEVPLRDSPSNMASAAHLTSSVPAASKYAAVPPLTAHKPSAPRTTKTPGSTLINRVPSNPALPPSPIFSSFLSNNPHRSSALNFIGLPGADKITLPMAKSSALHRTLPANNRISNATPPVSSTVVASESQESQGSSQTTIVSTQSSYTSARASIRSTTTLVNQVKPVATEEIDMKQRLAMLQNGISNLNSRMSTAPRASVAQQPVETASRSSIYPRIQPAATQTASAAQQVEAPATSEAAPVIPASIVAAKDPFSASITQNLTHILPAPMLPASMVQTTSSNMVEDLQKSVNEADTTIKATSPRIAKTAQTLINFFSSPVPTETFKIPSPKKMDFSHPPSMPMTSPTRERLYPMLPTPNAAPVQPPAPTMPILHRTSSVSNFVRALEEKMSGPAPPVPQLPQTFSLTKSTTPPQSPSQQQQPQSDCLMSFVSPVKATEASTVQYDADTEEVLDLDESMQVEQEKTLPITYERPITDEPSNRSGLSQSAPFRPSKPLSKPSDASSRTMVDGRASTISLAASVSSQASSKISTASGIAKSIPSTATKKVGKPEVKSLQLAAAAAKKEALEKERRAALKEARLAEQSKKTDIPAEKPKQGLVRKPTVEDLERKRKERDEMEASTKVKSVKSQVAKFDKANDDEPVKKAKLDSSAVKKAPEVKRIVKLAKPGESKTASGTSSVRSSTIQTSTARPPSQMSQSVPRPLQSTSSAIRPAGTSTATLKTNTAGKPVIKIAHSASAKAATAMASSAAKPVTKPAAEAPQPYIELPDIDSEYSDSEDESHARKIAALPDWAQSPNLRDALHRQKMYNPDDIFGAMPPLQMNEIFPGRGNRFRARTSSANWTGADQLTRQEEAAYAKRMGYTSSTLEVVSKQ